MAEQKETPCPLCGEPVKMVPPHIENHCEVAKAQREKIREEFAR